MLTIPPELKIEAAVVDIKQGPLLQQLASYLWLHWAPSYLLQKDISECDLWALIYNKFTDAVKQWRSREITWEILIQKIISTVESEEIEYKFTFELFPKAIFGLPDGDKLVVPAGNKVFSNSLEIGSDRITGYGSLPEYRKEIEKITMSFQGSGLKASLSDNFLCITLFSKNAEAARANAIGFADRFVHAWTLLAITPISFELISGWDHYARKVPQLSRWGFSFFSYNLESTKEEIGSAFNIALIDDLQLKRSLEYLMHAKRLDEIRNQAFSKSAETQRMLLADIELNLYKSITTIVDDPAISSRNYQKKYKEYGIDYNFWKTKIDKLREIRNNWGVAHYYLAEEKAKQLNLVVKESFEITKQTILIYIKYLHNKANAEVSSV